MTDKNISQNNVRLQRTVRFFETLLRASADGIVITDPAKNIVFVNDTFCEFFSSNRQDVIETNISVWLAKLCPDARDIWKGLENQINEYGIAKNVEFSMKTDEGMRYFTVNSSLLEKIDIEDEGLIISIWRDDTERKMAKLALQSAHNELELRVQERTAELTRANIELISQIDERKKAEEALSESEAKYRRLFEFSNDIIVHVDRYGKVLTVNNKLNEMLGITPEEVVGRYFFNLGILGLRDLPMILGLFKRTIRKGMIRDKAGRYLDKVELELRAKNGNLIFVETSTTFLKKDGKIEGFLTTVRDITERKRSDEMLKLHEIRLQDMLELHRLAGATEKQIFDFTLEASLRAVQSEVAFIGLMTADEAVMTKHSWSKKVMSHCQISEKSIKYHVAQAGLWGEVVRQRRPIIVNDYKTSKEPKKGFPQGHVPIKRFLGIPIISGNRIVAVACAANKDPDYTESDVSAFTSLIHEMWDILENKRTEEEISRNRAMLLKAQEIGNVGSWEWDIATNDLVWTKEMYKIYGLDPHFVKPKYDIILDTISPESKTEFLKAIDDALNSRKPFDMEYSLIRPDGSMSYVHARGEVMFDSDSRPIKMFGMAQDITQLKVAQAELVEVIKREQKALAEAEAARKLEQLKSMFMASTSHELRTPLNSIIGFTSLILDGTSGELNPDQKEQLTIVHSSGKHLLALINDIIDLSMIESGRLRILVSEFNLKQVVNEAVLNLNVSLNEKKLEMNVDVGDITMKSDRTRLLQCIINLLGNAIKYTEKGSVKITAKVNENFLELSVIDTGIGIIPRDIPKLFRPFVRLQSPLTLRTSGTGLGLYLVKKLARDFLRGDVEVKSEFGKGSTFMLRVPVKLEV